MRLADEKTMHHRVINYALAGAIIASALTALVGALMATGHLHLWGFEVVLGPGMIFAWLFTKGDNFTFNAEHAFYAIPFSLVLNVIPGSVLGALAGMLMSTKPRHQADKSR